MCIIMCVYVYNGSVTVLHVHSVTQCLDLILSPHRNQIIHMNTSTTHKYNTHAPLGQNDAAIAAQQVRLAVQREV